MKSITEPTSITIKMEPREDGGLRVYSDDVPGLVLSGFHHEAVVRDIGLALAGILLFSSKAEE